MVWVAYVYTASWLVDIMLRISSRDAHERERKWRKDGEEEQEVEKEKEKMNEGRMIFFRKAGLAPAVAY